MSLAYELGDSNGLRGTSMRALRFSVVGLLAVVGFLAVACAALINASTLWANILFTGLFTAFVALLLASLFSEGRRRATAVGALLSGVLYLVGVRYYESSLLTTTILERLHDAIPPERYPEPKFDRTARRIAEYRESLRRFKARMGDKDPSFLERERKLQIELAALRTFHTRNVFVQSGHYLSACIFVLFGGILARYFYGLRGPAP